MAIQPEVLDIGTFYSGCQVTISGEVPKGQDVVVEIAGPVANGQFDLKGRVGPFWMTNGRAEMDGAPAMYAILLPGGRDWQKKASSLGLGLERLRNEIAIQSATVPPDELFNMFLELKKSEGLYVVEDNAVAYAAENNGLRRFTAVCHFPRSTVAGNYTIKATEIINGAKGMELSRSFTVDEVGFSRLVYDLATNQRLVYGILAVAIALFAGAVMGLLFKGGGSH
ncbi:MAG: TIGR02186 family protein [Desulfobacterales bacterium]